VSPRRTHVFPREEEISSKEECRVFNSTGMKEVVEVPDLMSQSCCFGDCNRPFADRFDAPEAKLIRQHESYFLLNGVGNMFAKLHNLCSLTDYRTSCGT
jgi:hypothetical protein